MFAFGPKDVAFTPSVVPSVHVEYSFPSAAHCGYHVSAPEYFAQRPVKRIPLITLDAWNGQSAGGSDGHTRAA